VLSFGQVAIKYAMAPSQIPFDVLLNVELETKW
jgi:hypothetical protein